ncbi:MAG TPA: LURP-one-related family protein [Nitrososphaerales archaeon]|nr:LURP-one-related family protein [Nitrososphaerales archaeon]
MPYCQSCGKEINANAAFCPYCGAKTGLAAEDVAPIGSPSGVGGMTSSLLEANDIVMKKKILSVREHYDFEDVQGNKLGEGDGNFFQFPAKFQVLDSSGTQVMNLEAKLISIRRQFTFHDPQGSLLGAIKKKIVKLFGSEYWVEQDGNEFLRIYGNFVEHDYLFAVNGQQVAQVHKKWVAMRDTFGLSITGNVDHRIVIGSVIAIEHEEVTERHK